MQIIDRIAERILKDNMSVLKLSNETGISAYKIYKWLDKKGNPKHDDSIKLEQWLSGKVENVPKETKAEEPEIKIVSSNNDAYVEIIQLLKDKISLLEEKNERLEKELITNLKQNQEFLKAVMAQIKGASLMAILRSAGADKKKFLEERRTLDKYVGEFLSEP